MVLEAIRSLFGRRLRLPRDRVTRLPRAARKATLAQVAGVQAALDEIAALPGLADVAVTKRLPRGFFAAVTKLANAYEAYIAAVRTAIPELATAARPGTPDGYRSCYEPPFGVSGVEGAAIYRESRPWPDFGQVAQRLAQLGEQQFKDIQSLHTGKDPEKLRLAGKAVQQGRLDFARRREPCPFLHADTHRCRIWDQRPFACRMHHVVGDATWSDPQDPHYPGDVKVFNIRLPLRQQVALMQIEKRMMMQAAPILHANVLQWVSLSEGQVLTEAGEIAPRLAADGQVAAKANRNRPGAKKFQKTKHRK